MKAYLDLFFVNPEKVPRGLPQCKNDRGMNTWLREIYRGDQDVKHLEESITDFLNRSYTHYERMGKVEEVWMSLSIYTSNNRVNPGIHFSKSALSVLGKMDASLDLDVIYDA